MTKSVCWSRGRCLTATGSHVDVEIFLHSTDSIDDLWGSLPQLGMTYDALRIQDDEAGDHYGTRHRGFVASIKLRVRENWYRGSRPAR